MHRVGVLDRVEIKFPIRIGQNALAIFFLHHIALRFEIGFVQRQRRHPLSLGPENRIQIIRRHDLVINGHILRGVGVVFTTDVLRQIVESIGREMVVPLKHHVLEEMGETASPFRIIFRPDVIPDLDRHRRAGMIFHGVNLQSVGQSFVLKLQRRNGDRGFDSFHLGGGKKGTRQDKDGGESEREFHGKAWTPYTRLC